jgi:2-oxoglutarate/2-oxoacid ferredoxin oxidoreductase subunit alpha
VMTLPTLWPFPEDAVRRFLQFAKRSIVVEGNATGQLEGLIRQECLLTPDWHLRRYDGRPFSPEQIYTLVEEVSCRACRI